MAQWSALTAALTRDSVTFTWAELARIVGGLPESATNHRAWWSGDRPHVRVWRAAGYTMTDLRPGHSVTFVRTGTPTVPRQAAPADTRDIVLVACAKTKLGRPAPARDLYISPGFVKSRDYAEGSGHARIDEGLLTAWMNARLTVVTVPYLDADTLGRLEELVLRQIDPPLNLRGMAGSPIRARVSQLRRGLAGA